MAQQRYWTALSRRQFLHSAAGGALLAGGSDCLSGLAGEPPVAQNKATTADLPVSGLMRPGTEDFETALLDLIGEGEVPAALMCVSKNGQIVFNRAYGWLDSLERKPLRTSARIGLASLDKIITSTAIELLCKKRTVIPGTKLAVSKGLRPFDVFRQLGLGPADGTVRDERLFQVTVEHLLKHEGGLSESVHQGDVVERELQLKRLPTPSDSIAYLFHMPLKRDPGTQHEYNSAGYFVLRFLIDLAGGGFIPFLKRSVFGPAGAKDICLSRARPADRDPLEVRYLCANRGPSIFPEDHGRIIPEIEGGNGRYVDNHLVLATSAEAVVRYLDYWFFGSADRLWIQRPGRLAPRLNNGSGVYNGRMVGIRTGMQQRRGTMCNYAILTNWVRDRPGSKPQDFHKRVEKVLAGLHW
jgi:CubicO group peptidase (beta-lactamase class C family)